MATEIKQPVKSNVLEVSNLPKHLQEDENKGWLASLLVEAIRSDGKVVLVRVWRKVNGKAIESIIRLEEEETLTFIDGDRE